MQLNIFNFEIITQINKNADSFVMDIYLDIFSVSVDNLQMTLGVVL